MSDKFNIKGDMDWVDCSIFLMFSQAHMTDWELDELEIKTINEKAEIFVSHMAGEGMPYTDNDVNQKMKKAFNWYDSCLAGSNEELMSEVQKVASFIKNQDWFNPTFAQSLVDMLVDISKADGKVTDNEKGSLDSLAKYLGVELDWANIDDSNNTPSNDGSLDYPAITVRVFKNEDGERNDELTKSVHGFINKWTNKTKFYCSRSGIAGIIPDYFYDIDKSCPKWTEDELDFICNMSKDEKVIPILKYVPDNFITMSKQVWWLVPLVIWKEDIASWLYIDKNGFNAPHPDNLEGELIFPWDNIDHINFEKLEANLFRLKIFNSEGGFLTFDEFIPDESGSYLKMIDNIYNINKLTIDASRGQQAWFHGVGKEGFKVFENPNELTVFSNWEENIDRPNPAFYGYVEPESKVKEENNSSESSDDLLDSLLSSISDKLNDDDPEKNITTEELKGSLEQTSKRTPLLSAVANGESIEDIESIFKSKPDDLESTDPAEAGYTSLHYACWDGRADIAAFLIKSKADCSSVAADGRSPIHLAAANGHIDCVSLLVDAKVDVNICTNDKSNIYHGESGASPLRDAVLNQHWDIVDILLSNGADLNILLEDCLGKPNVTTNFIDAVREVGETNDGVQHNPDRLDHILHLIDQNNIKKETSSSSLKTKKNKLENNNLNLLSQEEVISILNSKILEKYENIDSKKANSGLISYYLDKKKFLQIAPYSKKRVEFLILRDSKQNYYRPVIDGLIIENIRKYDPLIDSYKKPWGYMFFKLVLNPDELSDFQDIILTLIESGFENANKNTILKVTDENHDRLGPIFSGTFNYKK